MKTVCRRAQGFTLIEVLITVFVLAIGLLTVAGLQATSRKVNYEALQRTTAAALAADLAERMRANPAAAAAAAYLTSDASAISTSETCTAASPCSAAEQAAYDLQRWNLQMQGAQETLAGSNSGGLVSPTGCVSLVGSVYQVAVAWRGGSRKETETQVPTGDPSRNACGQGLGRYDDPATTAADETLRRIVVVPVYVTDPLAAWKS